MARGHTLKRGLVWYVVLARGRDPATGKRKQQWIRTDARTKAEAERERTRLLRELDTGALVEPSRLTVAAYVASWLEGRKHRLEPSTHEKYAGRLANHVAPTIGALPLAALTPYHVQSWLDGLWAKGLGGGTVRHAWNLLNGALRAAVRLRVLAVNPCDAVEPPQEKPPALAGWDERHARIFRARIRGERDEALYLTLMGTGLRCGEALGLAWDDVDLKRAELRVVRQQRRTVARGTEVTAPKTPAAVRTVPLPAFVVAALRAHRARQNEERLRFGPVWEESGRVFTRPGGAPMPQDGIDGRWRRLRRRFPEWGLPDISPHGLRHLHATLGMARGLSPKVMAERLGHTSTRTTLDRYSHVTPAMHREAAAEFDAILDAPEEEPEQPSGTS